MEQSKQKWYTLSCEESLAALQTSFDGLKTEDVISRQSIYGKNILQKIGKNNFFIKFISQFKEALIILLL